MRAIKTALSLFSAALIALVLLTYYLLQPSGNIQQFRQHTSSDTALNRASAHQLSVRFFGVSTLLFDDGTDQLLIDGFFSRPSLRQVIGSKLNADLPLILQLRRQYSLNRTQAILVSHSHYDHALDLPALAEALPQAVILGSPSSLAVAGSGAAVKASQLQPIQPWTPVHFGAYQVTAIPSRHTPPTAVNNDLGEKIQHGFNMPAKFSSFKEGGSFDFLIQHKQQRILVKASTGFISGQLKNIQADTLFLGIAQLSRQSPEYQRQYFKETLGAVQPKNVIPIHWDDFFQPLQQPLQFLPRIADDAPKSMNLLIQAAQKYSAQPLLLTGPAPLRLSSQADESHLR